MARRGKALALVMLAAALVSTGALVVVLLAAETGRPATGTLALAVVLGLVAVVCAAIGVDALLGSRGRERGLPVQKLDFRHTRPLFLLLGLALVAGLVVRQLLVPDSFGEVGYFRAAALDEACQRLPRHLGNQACAECHEEKVALHDKDVHATVPCEDCHGPGWRHAQDPEQVAPQKPAGKAGCLVCHQTLAARPGAFPQVIWQEHFRFVGVADEKIACTTCHEPHEPLFMDRDIRTARLHPLIHRCRDCHLGRVNEQLPRPDGHPAIFECRYCHGDIVASFEQRPHRRVRCTTCHIFQKISDFAGRIIRDADPRFCLLCHREAEFRSESAAPGISWPDHLEDVAEDESDNDKRCIDCHRDRIHTMIEKQEPTHESARK